MPDLARLYSMSGKDDIMSLYKILLSSDFGIWLWEPLGDSLYFNELYTQMLGYPSDTFPYHISTWERLIHPDDRESIIREQLNVLADPTLGDTFQSRFRMRKFNGDYLWVLGRGFVLCRDANGQAVRVVGMHLDLKSMDATLEAVAVQHDRMWFALEAAQDGLWDWNPQTEDVYFSPRYFEMLGYTAGDFPSHVSSWVQRVHPDDLEATVEMQYTCIKDPSHGDMFDCVYRFLAANGQYKWILGRGKVTRRDAEGKATRLVGLHTDITELRNTQERLGQLLNTDALTGLYSRFYFDSALDRMLVAHEYPVSIIYGDIDGLKLVNDNLGHVKGDGLLVTAANILRQSLDASTIAARIGGDEFAVLLTHCAQKDAEKLVRHIQENIAKHNAATDDIPICMALGVVCTEDDMPLHRLLAQADAAMMEDKMYSRTANHQMIKDWISQQTGTTINFADPRL